MKIIFLVIISLGFRTVSFAQKFDQKFVSTDIDNFWMAYDKIASTKDSTKQFSLLREIYLDNATPGLRSIIEARNYSEKEFIDMIAKYTNFWKSIKPNTLKVSNLYSEINADIKKLKKSYPDLKPATIYFTVGAFRTNGTIQGDKILIGSELALADKKTEIDELPEARKRFYKTQNPINEVALLCTHEYVHTQQKELVQNLISMCLYEGVAEFISCKVTGKKSASPAIEFGKANQKIVVEKFVSDMFTMTHNSNWIWGDNRNELLVRDLGYYIGYEICERYYNQSIDKQKAVRELIELDYSDDKEVERIVDGSGLLPEPLEVLRNDYEKQRPTVVSLLPFENGNQNAKSGIIQISINFSEEMDVNFRGFDYGPLGKDYSYKFRKLIGWTNNSKTITIEVEIEPGKRYQAFVTNSFKNKKGIALKPYLIEFKTSE